MKAKFGAIVVDGRGKIGGHVASKNRAGSYFRTKVSPVNPQTGFQLGVRNRFTGLSQGWRGLTQEQRDAWNGAVSDYARTDIFGDLRQPTGFNLYQRLNNNLINVGESAISTPPLPESVGEVVATGLTAEDGTVAESLSLTLAGAVPANTAVKVYATAPQSAGRSFVKSQYRQIDVLNTGSASPVDLLSAYQAKFGSTGSAGQKIFVKLEAVNTNTGQVGTPSEVSAIVTVSAI
jgi:hypothetical protein